MSPAAAATRPRLRAIGSWVSRVATPFGAGAPVAPIAGIARHAGTAARRDRQLDWGILAVFVAALVEVLAIGHWYPGHRYDPDLLAQLAFFRNWQSGDTSLWQLPYFTAPKVLLVYTLGALGDVTLAFACSAVVAAALNAVAYLVWRDNFGRPTAMLASLLLLLDSSRSIMAVKSGADLYLTAALFLAILLCDRGHTIGAAMALLAAALIKPVALPCAAYLVISAPRAPRRWAAAAIPLLALPILMLSNRALLGGVWRGSEFFGEFASMGGAAAIGAGDVVHFALWHQLVASRFAATASFAAIGMVLWVADDRTRLERPLLLLPLLVLAGYVGLAVVTPFPPYFRYFWPLEIWMLGFMIFGAVETGRRIATERSWVAASVPAAVALLVADGMVVRALEYRGQHAAPMEAAMRFADSARSELLARERPTDAIVVPLGLLPYVAWYLPEAIRAHRVDVAERAARDDSDIEPDWIVHIPGMYTSDRAREWVAALLGRREYAVALGDSGAALLGPPAANRSDTQRENP